MKKPRDESSSTPPPPLPVTAAPEATSGAMDPDAPPTEEELREAAELREALGDASLSHEGAALARAVVLAHAPRDLDPEVNAALLERALRGTEAKVVALAFARARARRRRTFFLGSGASALALAAAMLVFQSSQPEPVATLDVPMHARSSQPLFHEPFAPHDRGSARIDRIASARAGDLRENMFAHWQVGDAR